MQLPRITIVTTAAALTDVNRICHAMGLGTAYLGVPLCAIDPEATYETPATHYLSNDMSALDSEAPVWQGMAQEADLPPINGTWGEDGVISAQDAQAALAFGNVKVSRRRAKIRRCSGSMACCSAAACSSFLTSRSDPTPPEARQGPSFGAAFFYGRSPRPPVACRYP